MALNMIEVTLPRSARDAVEHLLKDDCILDRVTYDAAPEGAQGEIVLRLLARGSGRQQFIDDLQSALSAHGQAWRISLIPVDATIPDPRDGEGPDGPESDEGGDPKLALREQLFTTIAAGITLNTNYFVFVTLSTLVAAVGLLENNVAVIIGAMIIAPLLGPNTALAFGATLGDRGLIFDALRTIAAGLAIVLVMSVVIGTLWPESVSQPEVLARTRVPLSSVVLALASGAAAALSVTTGLPTALVGVMVAVAILPPTVVVGLTLGGGRPDLAFSALLLLAVNVVSLNLAAQLVFVWKQIRPRHWLEQRAAKQSVRWTIAFWSVALAVLVLLILWVGHEPLVPDLADSTAAVHCAGCT